MRTVFERITGAPHTLPVSSLKLCTQAASQSQDSSLMRSFRREKELFTNVMNVSCLTCESHYTGFLDIFQIAIHGLSQEERSMDSFGAFLHCTGPFTRESHPPPREFNNE